MEELRWAFLVLGGCAIIAILAHGIWSVRKNAHKDEQEYQPRKLQHGEDAYEDDESLIHTDIQIDEGDPLLDDNPQSTTQQDKTAAAYDALGIGSVRVISGHSDEQAEQPDAEALVSDEPEQTEQAQLPEEVEPVVESAEPSSAAEELPKVYDAVVTQPKPEYLAEQQAREKRQRQGSLDGDVIPEPPSSLLRAQPSAENKPSEVTEPETEKDEPSFKLDQVDLKVPVEDKPKPKVSLTEQAKNLVSRKKDEPTRKRKVRVAANEKEQMRIDFDEPDIAATGEPTAEVEQEVLVLNVKAAADNNIPGSALLPMLLTLGFKFGDQRIFHRHVNSNGKGPVLFSLANMFKPGDFDIDNLENFTTQGISLFMILPIEGDPHQVFNMMHNAARKIADEFSAQVLDGRRSALTKQSLQQYVEKIREFERKRRIKR